MKVLFLGNSHTFVHHVPARVMRYCAEQGENVEAVMLCKGGMGLDWHAAEPQTAYNLTFGKYDAVVLQHVAHPFPGREHLISSAETLNDFIPEGTKKLMYMTWSEKINPQGQEEMCAAYEEAAKAIGAGICPVGRIWKEVRETHPEEELYFSDGEHSSVLGASLAAVVISRTLLGNPADNGEQCFEEAKKLAQWEDPKEIVFTAAGVGYQK